MVCFLLSVFKCLNDIIMKKTISTLLLLLFGIISFAQDSMQSAQPMQPMMGDSMQSMTGDSMKLMKRRSPYYTVSGGLLGAANFTKFRIGGNNPGDIKYDVGTGYSGGVWLNFPFSRAVSFEVQGVYSSYKLTPDNKNGTQFEGNMNYISVPAFFKFHLGRRFALIAGAQFDFLNKVEDDNNNLGKEDFSKDGIALNGGFEVFPHDRLTIFARYMHGLKNLDNSNNPNTTVEFYNQGIQAGLKLKLFGKRIVPPPPDSDADGVIDTDDKCPLQVGTAKYMGCPIPDTDGDGINDDMDKCPSQAGTAKYEGCPVPDADKDGVNDEVDKCPNEAGTAKYNGCPVPDSDGDGINDDEDKCPGVAGTKEYQGCPIPDTDKDGIIDTEDKCPTIAGVKENDGCPAIPKLNAAAVQFVTGSSKLTSGALTELNDIVTYLKEYPQMRLTINGHTDNVGKEEMNQALSEKRANAIVEALVKKGVDASRLQAAGFGMTQPVADNSTALGRTKNRRVEFKFSQEAGSK